LQSAMVPAGCDSPAPQRPTVCGIQPDEELGYTAGAEVVVGGATGRVVVVGLGAGRVVACCVGTALECAAAVGRCADVGTALVFGAGAGAALVVAADVAVLGSAVAGASALVVLCAPTSFCGAGELLAVDWHAVAPHARVRAAKVMAKRRLTNGFPPEDAGPRTGRGSRPPAPFEE
jgi:hypothetical protein